MIEQIMPIQNMRHKLYKKWRIFIRGLWPMMGLCLIEHKNMSLAEASSEVIHKRILEIEEMEV